jgi:hypothetical protein
MFVIRGADTVWYFPPGPSQHAAIYFGYIADGQVQTKFSIISKPGYTPGGEINYGADPYGIAANQGTTPEAEITAGSSTLSPSRWRPPL